MSGRKYALQLQVSANLLDRLEGAARRCDRDLESWAIAVLAAATGAVEGALACPMLGATVAALSCFPDVDQDLD